jgi:hypothetical protein
MKSTSYFRDCGVIEAKNNFLRLLEKVNKSRKIKMLLTRVTTSLSLRNYLPPPERYGNGYNKYFFRIQWSS